jgi:hypothetical protein
MYNITMKVCMPMPGAYKQENTTQLELNETVDSKLQGKGKDWPV